MKNSSFSEFYLFYLGEHKNVNCRRLHFIGTFLVLISLILGVLRMNLNYILVSPILGYGFAWFGHFVFEKNRPATFKSPVFSFLCDWRMFWDILRGKISLIN